MEYIEDYKRLGLKLGSSKEDIKSAYKKLVKKYHPDKTGNYKDYEDFIKLTESYNRLLNINEVKIERDDFNFYVNMYIDIIKYLYNVIKEKLIEKTNEWYSKSKYERTKDINICLKVSVEDLYNCHIKKIRVKVLRLENNKLKKKIEDYYISLANYKSYYRFKEKSDDGINKLNGDIIVNLLIDDKIYYIKNVNSDERYDINMEVDKEEIEINVMGETIKINENKEDRKIILKNKGIKYKKEEKIYRGNLIIYLI